LNIGDAAKNGTEDKMQKEVEEETTVSTFGKAVPDFALFNKKKTV
jgi:hypothetical protein